MFTAHLALLCCSQAGPDMRAGLDPLTSHVCRRQPAQCPTCQGTSPAPVAPSARPLRHSLCQSTPRARRTLLWGWAMRSSSAAIPRLPLARPPCALPRCMPHRQHRSPARTRPAAHQHRRCVGCKVCLRSPFHWVGRVLQSSGWCAHLFAVCVQELKLRCGAHPRRHDQVRLSSWLVSTAVSYVVMQRRPQAPAKRLHDISSRVHACRCTCSTRERLAWGACAQRRHLHHDRPPVVWRGGQPQPDLCRRVQHRHQHAAQPDACDKPAVLGGERGTSTCRSSVPSQLLLSFGLRCTSPALGASVGHGRGMSMLQTGVHAPT